MEINNIDDLSSDHLVIVLTLSNTILHKEAVPKLTNKFTDWEVFHDGVNKNISLHVQLTLSLIYALQKEAKAATLAGTPRNHSYAKNPHKIVEFVKKRIQACHC